MAAARFYDLMVLLDPESGDEQRARVIEQIRTQVSSGSGTVKGDADWGLRRLAYEIDHRPEAHYHLFQLEASGGLLEQLERSLSIDDAVLRHRIIRLAGEPPEVTPRPDPPAPAVSEPEPDAPAGDAVEPAVEQANAIEPDAAQPAPDVDAPAEAGDEPSPAGADQAPPAPADEPAGTPDDAPAAG